MPGATLNAVESTLAERGGRSAWLLLGGSEGHARRALSSERTKDSSALAVALSLQCVELSSVSAAEAALQLVQRLLLASKALPTWLLGFGTQHMNAAARVCPSHAGLFGRIPEPVHGFDRRSHPQGLPAEQGQNALVAGGGQMARFVIRLWVGNSRVWR